MELTSEEPSHLHAAVLMALADGFEAAKGRVRRSCTVDLRLVY